MRLKIRTLMIVIAVVAAVLAAAIVPGFLGALLLAAFIGCCIAATIGLWLQFRSHARQSALGFGMTAAFTNGVSHLMSLLLPMIGSAAIMVVILTCLILTPAVLGFGAAWSSTTARDPKVSRASRVFRWTAVLVLSLAPFGVIMTEWPLRLAFVASRSALERLAARVEAGGAITTPEWAGPFRIVGSAFDRTTGNVGLITNFRPSGRTGFEHYGRQGRRDRGGAFFNFWWYMELDSNWRYAEED
jgi:hypothetical protein